MKDTKTLFFSFDAQDYRTVQLWLEEIDRAGWTLVTLKGTQFPRAKLRRREGPSVHYCVDVADSPLKSAEERDAYLTLCSDAGWELVVSFRGLNLFRAQPGRDPVPIQTDPELERRRLWRRVVMPNLVGSGVGLLLSLLLGWAVLRATHLRLFLTNYYLLALLIAFLSSLVWFTRSIVSSTAFALRLRRGDLPSPDLGRTRRKGIYAAVATVLSLCFPLLLIITMPMLYGSPPVILERPPALTWADLGRTGEDCWGLEGGTVLLSYRQSSQSASERPQDASTPTLQVEEYRAAYPWVADLVYADLRREVPADAPGLVVLRLGDTVLRLEGPAELTDPGLPTVIAANLAGR